MQRVLKLLVCVDGESEFLTNCVSDMSVADFTKKIEKEMKSYFTASDELRIIRLQTSTHADVPVNYRMGEVFQSGDIVFPLRNIIFVRNNGGIKSRDRGYRIQPRLLYLIKDEQPRQKGTTFYPSPIKDVSHKPPMIKQTFVAAADFPLHGLEGKNTPELEGTTTEVLDTRPTARVIAPALSSTSNLRMSGANAKSVSTKNRDHAKPHKCEPYCVPLAPYNTYNEICQICGEVKAFLPTSTNTLECTPLCIATVRKQKCKGLDFCSICLGRKRKGIYAPGLPHQCKQCKRPWMLLNEQGICRTCHNRDHKDSGIFRAVGVQDRNSS